MKEARELISEPNNALVFLIIIFVIAALGFGIPAILKGSLKGVVLSIVTTLLATFGTYIFLF